MYVSLIWSVLYQRFHCTPLSDSTLIAMQYLEFMTSMILEESVIHNFSLNLLRFYTQFMFLDGVIITSL